MKQLFKAGNKMRTSLKVALVQGGISQIELARLIESSPARISRIMRGHVKPRARERLRISRALRAPSWRIFPDAGRGRLVGRKAGQ